MCHFFYICFVSAYEEGDEVIYSSIYSKVSIGAQSEIIAEAIEFLSKTDFSTYDDGEYEISGRDKFFQVRDIETSSVENCRPEVHRKYIDVQFLYRGKERIGVVPDKGSYPVSEDLLAQRDILFYESVDGETFINMSVGDYCVFFPGDVHRPGCEKDGSSLIRKIVYKINVDLLEDK